jgi:hypothetical protein
MRVLRSIRPTPGRPSDFIRWLEKECPHALGDSSLCSECATAISNYIKSTVRAVDAVRDLMWELQELGASGESE